MPDMKEMAFMYLIILVSINALVGFVEMDPVLKHNFGLKSIDDLNATSVLGSVSGVDIGTNSSIEPAQRTDLVSTMATMYNFFSIVIGFLFNLAFGYSTLLLSIFSPIGETGLAYVFIAPIAVIEVIAVLYILRDLVATIRGVG
jgi:hypothetical protein